FGDEDRELLEIAVGRHLGDGGDRVRPVDADGLGLAVEQFADGLVDQGHLGGQQVDAGRLLEQAGDVADAGGDLVEVRLHEVDQRLGGGDLGRDSHVQRVVQVGPGEVQLQVPQVEVERRHLERGFQVQVGGAAGDADELEVDQVARQLRLVQRDQP